MNAKIPGLVFVLVLLASLFTESESYFGAGGMVGRKRSDKQVSRVTNPVKKWGCVMEILLVLLLVLTWGAVVEWLARWT